MKPQLFDSKNRLKWIPFAYLAVLVFAICPFLSAWLASVIGDGMGCNINEGGTDTCVRIGIPFGVVLNSMVSGVWLFFLTIPVGAILLVILTIVTINDKSYLTKRND
jgi:hypothetical protein